MKYSAVMIAAAGLVAAQNPTDYFPTCAISCLDDAITADTTCSVTDYACQCTTDNQSLIQGGATSCVISACGADVAVSTVLPAAASFCAAVSAGGSSSTGAASTSAAETPTAETTSAAETSAAGTTSEGSSSSAAATTTMAATTTAANGTTTSTPTSTPVEVNAAAGNSVGVIGGIAALFLAAVAAL